VNTRDRIIDAALDLFNQHGTASISTNHIAEALGMSPGNLYYHFRNKDEIVRGIFERLFAEWDAAFAVPDEPAALSLGFVRELVAANFAIMRRYSFVYREIIALLRQDAALAEQYVAVRARGYEGFAELFAALAASGVILAAGAEDTRRLADLCWLISEFWFSSIEISGQAVDDAQVARGIDLMLFTLRPHLNTP
jgi:AcrR family transcriptional regulator